MHANRVPLHLRWIPPRINYYKLNTDGATSSAMDTDGIGGVIRNHMGDWMVGFAGAVPHVHCITAELQALIKGLSIAIQVRLLPLEVEIDAKEVTTLMSSETSKYANLIFDCKYLLRILHDPVVMHAYREQNGVADHLAKLGSRMPLAALLQLFVKPPSSVSTQLLADQRGLISQHMVPITDVQQLDDKASNICFVTNHVSNETVEHNFGNLSSTNAVYTSLEDRQCENPRVDTSRRYDGNDSIVNISVCNMVHEHQNLVRMF
ncbi:putative ribonuclease h protein [Nicotiana attenuata]|uniref:Ribonuclease h protein n=1 Tax=Nicotiana attenuata TaxID=49451 RepID=A0A314LE92_NICAT|nr:putative ribonuclease h protein [Nicotiana attenuata]